MATVKELRELERNELLARAAELKQTLFDLKNKHSTGVLDSTADLAKTKREVARILMVAREKEISAAKAATPQGAPKMKAATPRRTDLEAKE
ncbi:50S ribosomal protein L29 [Anaeromyxobacter sp. Fw109-5]|uniref:50S ribosomal protein L29 n=1 Tax=Anaeromyxobacter sp. (strain Fw109-5) TaxID=404589 RepID=UPI0000ED81E7|nr:50S ribosomal protein L29 [Anaeromyxobacter sp. Fw109-5]ABS26122.1 ribosomal protein L29 [Anaeromyxobacter sp. Fw109-5]